MVPLLLLPLGNAHGEARLQIHQRVAPAAHLGDDTWTAQQFGRIGLPLPWREYVDISAHTLIDVGCTSADLPGSTGTVSRERCRAFSDCNSKSACQLVAKASMHRVKAETGPLTSQAVAKCKSNALHPHRCQFNSFAPDAGAYLLFFSEMKRRGFFFEMGANTGRLAESNSWFFEKALGWGGHLVEASPNIFEQLVQSRGNRTGVKLINKCAHPTERSLEMTELGPMSTLNENTELVERNQKHVHGSTLNKVTVSCAPLDELVAGLPVIDVLFLDCEGCELGALQSFSWRVAVHVIDIERGNDDRAIAKLLLARGFEYVRENRGDRLFVNVSWASRSVGRTS